MSELLVTTLRETLIEEGRATLPGLGTFTLAAEPAVISGAEKKVLPPSASIKFNSNLRVDDGRLQQRLVRQKGLLRSEAKRETEGFVEHIKSALATGELVDIEGLGHFFQHFTGEISFTSTGTGLAKESFALPRVAITPIRRKPVAQSPVSPAAAAVSAAAVPPGQAVDSGLSKEAWYAVMAVLFIILAWLLYMLLSIAFGSVTDDPTRPTTKENNVVTRPVSPPNTAPAAAQVPAQTVSPDEPPRLNGGVIDRGVGEQNVSTETPEKPDGTRANTNAATDEVVASTRSEADTNAGLPNTAVIATGLFGNKAYVRKNVLRIEQAGYEAFTQTAGRYTRIGVKVNYRNDEELNRELAKVRDQFTTDAFVMYINGKEVD